VKYDIILSSRAQRWGNCGEIVAKRLENKDFKECVTVWFVDWSDEIKGGLKRGCADVGALLQFVNLNLLSTSSGIEYSM
jgi:hypothetical protein